MLVSELLDPQAAFPPVLLDLKILITVKVIEFIDFVSPCSVIVVSELDLIAPLWYMLKDLLLTTHHVIEVLDLLILILLFLLLLLALLLIFVFIILLGHFYLVKQLEREFFV